MTSATIEMITPETAALLLGSNIHNRKLSEARVRVLARDITEGRWQLNGEAVKVAEDGTLLDGQHRLAAVVHSGMAVSTLVVRGLPVEAQTTMDTGRARTVSDILRLQGIHNGHLMGAIAVGLIGYEAGKVHVWGGARASAPSKLEQVEYVQSHDLRDATVASMRATSVKAPLAGAIFGVAMEVAGRVAPGEAEAFFIRGLVEGIGLQPGDPILALRRRLSGLPPASSSATRNDYLWLTLRAFEAYRRGERLEKLQIPRGGWTAANTCRPERFRSAPTATEDAA